MADYSLNSNFTPNTPITPFTEVDFLIAANTNLTNLQSQSASQKPFGANVAPSVKKTFKLKKNFFVPHSLHIISVGLIHLHQLLIGLKHIKNLIIFSIKN